MADHDPTAAVKESHSRSPAEGSDHSSPNDPSNAAMAEFHLNIEVGSDQDSTFGGSEEGGSTTTTSLASSVFDYVYEVSTDAPVSPPPSGHDGLPAPD